MDAIKQTLSDAASTVQSAAGNDTNSGAHPSPAAFSNAAHSQRDEGRAVGIQADMAETPKTTDQEGEDEFSSYKPAGKMVDRKTIVTGGDSGIGRAAAVMYAMEGADVAIVYMPEEQVDADKVEQTIKGLGKLPALDLHDQNGS
jgi:hypothetical protein